MPGSDASRQFARSARRGLRMDPTPSVYPGRCRNPATDPAPWTVYEAGGGYLRQVGPDTHRSGRVVWTVCLRLALNVCEKAIRIPGGVVLADCRDHPGPGRSGVAVDPCHGTRH
jgi:hypothetical protein